MAEEIYSQDPLMIEESLEEWVITKCENWRDHYESNYEQSFEEYYRLWRGQWDPADSERVNFKIIMIRNFFSFQILLLMMIL